MTGFIGGGSIDIPLGNIFEDILIFFEFPVELKYYIKSKYCSKVKKKESLIGWMVVFLLDMSFNLVDI